MNVSCNVLVASRLDTLVLNKNCSSPINNVESPATTILFSTEAGVAFLLSCIIYLKFNSVSVLNLSIRIGAISNTWWIFYFCVIGIRCVIGGIQYSYRFTEEGFFNAEFILIAIEGLLLTFAINYQRKYRSSARISEEIDAYSKADHLNSSWIPREIINTVSYDGALILFQSVAVVIVILISIFIKSSHPINWFWIYVAFILSVKLTQIVLSLFIAIKSSTDGPSLAMKSLLLLGVLLQIPADIPLFLWNFCALQHCMSGLMTIYDVWIVLKIASSVFLVFALGIEYNRLKQECQWAMLNEVQRFSF